MQFRLNRSGHNPFKHLVLPILFAVLALTGCASDDGSGGRMGQADSGSNLDDGGVSSDASTVMDSGLLVDATRDASLRDTSVQDTSVDAQIPMDMGQEDDMWIEPDTGTADAACNCVGNQICDRGTCLEPDVCEAHRDCLGARLCENGMCRDACLDNNDCPDGETCDLVTQTCTDSGPCMSDDQCGGNICVDGQCNPRCRVDDNCPGLQVCELNSGRCLEPANCVADQDCNEGRRCVDRACVDPCIESAQCAGAQRCNDGICAEPNICTDNTDCLGDRVCVGQAGMAACQDPCSVVPCMGGLTCDRITGQCQEASPCADADGCFANRVCTDGACNDPCLEPADCPGAQDCIDGQCTEPDFCNGAFDCNPGRVCVEGQCQDNCERVPCDGALLCQRETGECVEASPCNDNSGCFEDRVCEANVCSDPCLEPADCPGGMSCVNGRCEEPEFCRGAFDCFVGRRCIDGSCRNECVDGGCLGTRICDQTNLCVEGPTCAGDRDCDDDRLCDVQAERCTEPCMVDVQCPANLECGPDGLCREPRYCAPGDECLDGQECLFAHCYTVDCRQDIDCGGDLFCVGFTCLADRPGECNCPEDWACDDGHCVQPAPCAQAQGNAGEQGCPQGLRCAQDGRCVDCTADADCERGVCDGARCVNPEPCDIADDCLEGHQCNGGVCSLPRDHCDEDTLNNGDFGFAANLVYGTIPDLMACEGRADWYRVNDNVGARITVRYDSATTALDVRAYTREQLGRDAADVGEAIGNENWINVGRGIYYIRVTALEGGSGVYSITTEGNVSCLDDQFERPWRNDIPGNARDIDAGEIAANLCDNDVDHYQYLGNDGTVEISVEGNVFGTFNGEPLPQTAFGPGIIRIDGEGAYTLSIAPDDRPEARCARAQVVQINSTFNGSADRPINTFSADCHLQDGTDAVFAFDPPGAGTVTARLENLDPDARLRVMNDCTQEPIACGDNFGRVTAAVGAGRHYLIVDGNYRGDITLTFDGENPVCQAAPDLAAGNPVQVELNQRNPDVDGGCLNEAAGQAIYRFSVQQDSMVSLDIDSADQNAIASIRTVCSDAAGELRCQANNGNTRTRFMPAGDYYAVINSDSPVTAQLTIEPGGQPGPPSPADACGAAPEYDLAGGPTNGAVLEDDFDSFNPDCRGGSNPDRVYRISIVEPTTLIGRLSIPNPTTAIMVYGACNQNPINCGEGGPNLRQDLDPGDYYVVIDGPNDGEMELILDPPPGEGGGATPAEACERAPELTHGVPSAAESIGRSDNFSPDCAPPGSIDRAFRINLDRRATINARLEQPQPGTSLLLYRDCEGEVVACGDEDGALSQRVPAGEYFIIIDGFNEGDLLVELDPPPGAPVIETPAEACQQAPVLPTGASNINVGGGADNLFVGACGLGDTPEQAYRIDIADPATLRVTLTEPAAAAQPVLYQDCSQAAVACPSNDGIMEHDVDPGTYYVVIEGQYGGGVDVALAERAEACADATPIADGQNVESPLNLTPPPYGGNCLGVGNQQALHRFELAEASRVRVTTSAANPVALSLRTNCDDGNSELSCQSGAQPTLEADLDAGVHFVIVESDGDVELRLEVNPDDNAGPRLDDTCEPAEEGEIILRGTQVQLQDTTATATDASNAATCDNGAGPGGKDRVFLFGLAERAQVTASVQGAEFTPVIKLLDGGCFGQESCSPIDDANITRELEAGQHAIIIDSTGALEDGAFTLTISVD
ncbi:MAG: hypothetical protein CMH52_06745 [Myxococcales bacterium]|nr:hypothetical protein [Myxococcales bacterium]